VRLDLVLVQDLLSRSVVKIKTLTLFILSLSFAACSNNVDEVDEDGGESGDTGETLDLFACNVPVDCVQDVGHLGEGQTDEASRCGGELVASGKAGAVLSMSQPGPYPTEDEHLVVIGADGTAYRQLRARCMTEGACEDQNTTAWRRTELQRCTVEVKPEWIAGCGTPDGECAWFGQTKDCVPVAADWTCDDLPK
jgi:hypothetical protein